jgi:beta-lactamase superfamily II metal-dependent hydrolase
VEAVVYELDFLSVGNAGKSGDAICMRFTRPDSGADAVVVVDAGFKENGEALVDHIQRYYGTNTVDLAILTHPDGDHIGGMGEVMRGLDVAELWLHDIAAHGGGSLPAAAAVNDLIALAREEGATVSEPWPGASAFGGALTVLGPAKEYYDELVGEQVAGSSTVTKAAGTLLEAARSLADRIAGALGLEIPFEAQDVNPRNNSSMILLAKLDGEIKLLTSDAGVPALSAAWDYADSAGLGGTPTFAQIPHHGSRRNCSSSWLDRLLGETGQPEGARTALVSCVKDSEKHPSGKVVNAYKRRGCRVVATAGNSICHSSSGVPNRGWGPATPLGPLVEVDD